MIYQHLCPSSISQIPDSKVHGAYTGPIWDRQDPGGPHVGPMNLALRDNMQTTETWFVMKGRLGINKCISECDEQFVWRVLGNGYILDGCLRSSVYIIFADWRTLALSKWWCWENSMYFWIHCSYESNWHLENPPAPWKSTCWNIWIISYS